MRRSHLIATLPLFLGLALIVSQALADFFTGRVVGVTDGDTITVLHNGKVNVSASTALTVLRSIRPSASAQSSSRHGSPMESKSQ